MSEKNSTENKTQETVTDNETESNNPSDTPKKSPGPIAVIGSVLSAMIGIQSDENRERDFNSGHIGNYIFVGIVVVIIFIFTLISIVNNILEEAGM